MRRQPDKPLADGQTQIALQREWREDFVGEALTILVNPEQRAVRIEFYSADHGVVQWTAGHGLGTARRWEGEAALSDENAHQRHFPAFLLDGATADPHSWATVEAVLSHVDHRPLVDWVRAALAEPHLPHCPGQALPPQRLPVAGASQQPRRNLGRAVLDLMRDYTAWSKRSD